MKFLHKVINSLLAENKDLSNVNIVIPGKRPIVFIKKILKENNYSGLLPQFFTIEDLVKNMASQQEIKGIGLWLFAYQIYRDIFPSEDFSNFLKWFPTLAKDWDDLLKFSNGDTQVLDFMLNEERIKEWAQNLGDDPQIPRNKFLDFWKKMNVFLPQLKKKLSEKKWATSGMLHAMAKDKVEKFAHDTPSNWVFIGFNALTPLEDKIIKSLLQWDKAQCFFQADAYYLDDTKQEAGKFLRSHKTWKEFNDYRPFNWVEDDFKNEKNIKVYEVSGNISQAKVLPDIFRNISSDKLSETAIVLLDENLLPATLETLSMVEYINITMGFPLRNLAFSTAVKQIFYLQKQLNKKDNSYYYRDIMSVLDALPFSEEELVVIQEFKNYIENRNIIFISKKMLSDNLSTLSCFPLLLKMNSVDEFLNLWISVCQNLKSLPMDDVMYENISHFEKSFTLLKNHLQPYHYQFEIDALEVLIQQLVNQEAIDFQGEPLQGLQIMGLLETRLLNFENIILLSVNEGKLPLGNTQNTFLPHDVRVEFKLQTFLENDSIYAYHFYRLLQDSQNVHLLYNALSSGVNTGEKSRFITQLEIESSHKLEHIVVENTSEPSENKAMTIAKSDFVQERLQDWKKSISVSHLNSYLYNPIDFYLNKIMKTKESIEMEEELSARNYGNLVHFSLEFLYQDWKGKKLTKDFFQDQETKVNNALIFAIEELNQQPEFYEKGMNFIHKQMAEKVIHQILNYDFELIEDGNSLEIIDLEYQFKDIEFPIGENETIAFHGYIDRIDKLNGEIRILDYKTAKTSGLNLKIDDKNIDKFFFNTDKKQALQLCVYQYVVGNLLEFKGQNIETAIWSFADVNKGPVSVNFEKGNLDDALVSVKNIILEILNPEIDFVAPE